MVANISDKYRAILMAYWRLPQLERLRLTRHRLVGASKYQPHQGKQECARRKYRGDA